MASARANPSRRSRRTAGHRALGKQAVVLAGEAVDERCRLRRRRVQAGLMHVSDHPIRISIDRRQANNATARIIILLVVVEARPPGRPREARVDEAVRTATIELLAERGYAGVTIEGVAAKAGVGKTAIYRRFPSKAELVFDAAVHGLELLPPEDTGSLRGDLAALIQGIVASLTGPASEAAIPGLIADLGRDPRLAARFQQTFVAQEDALVAAVLERAVARGELRAAFDLELAHALLLGPVFAWLHLVRRPPADLAERLAECVEAALVSVSNEERR
jgi:AcrR family transcriptional regulator